MSRVLLRGGRVLDPASGRDGAFEVLIENGRIADSGTHDAMCAQGGAYARWEAREELKEKLAEL